MVLLPERLLPREANPTRSVQAPVWDMGKEHTAGGRGFYQMNVGQGTQQVLWIMQTATGVPWDPHRPVTPSAYAPSLAERAILGMFRRAEKYLIRTIFYHPVNKVRGPNCFGLSFWPKIAYSVHKNITTVNSDNLRTRNEHWYLKMSLFDSTERQGLNLDMKLWHFLL